MVGNLERKSVWRDDLFLNLNNPLWIILSEFLKQPVDAQVVSPIHFTVKESGYEFEMLFCFLLSLPFLNCLFIYYIYLINYNSC
jgi:hypothetical protein